MLRRAMADRAAQQRVLAQVDPADLVGLASAVIRIPSFNRRPRGRQNPAYRLTPASCRAFDNAFATGTSAG